MSGSNRCTPKRRTAPHDITNGRGAELIELAVVVTHDPDAVGARAALARVAGELLEQGADAIINQSLQSAPNRRIAQTLQHVVERASERSVIQRNRARAERELVAIPVIATFEQDVPETQFEAALRSLGRLKDLAVRRKDARLELAQVVLLPDLFRLDDLNALPLSTVRKRAVNLGTAAASRRDEWHLSMTHARSFKRSRAFLRFLVGQRQLPGQDVGAAGATELCERLGDLTKRAIERYLGLPCDVQVVCMGPFHESLYSGMWLYQEKRLDQLARASCAQTGGKKHLEARVMICGRGHRFEAWVGFFAGNEVIGGHAYRLGSRPGEDPSLCVARITRRLEAAGVKTNALSNSVPEGMGAGIRTGRRSEASITAIPI